MVKMRNTKFGLVSPTEANCLGHLESELKDGHWVHGRPEKKPKPYRQVTRVWRNSDEEVSFTNSHIVHAIQNGKPSLKGWEN